MKPFERRQREPDDTYLSSDEPIQWRDLVLRRPYIEADHLARQLFPDEPEVTGYHVSRAMGGRVLQLIDHGDIILPSFQFRTPPQLLRGALEVNDTLFERAERHGISNWGVAAWWLQAHSLQAHLATEYPKLSNPSTALGAVPLPRIVALAEESDYFFKPV